MDQWPPSTREGYILYYGTRYEQLTDEQKETLYKIRDPDQKIHYQNVWLQRARVGFIEERTDSYRAQIEFERVPIDADYMKILLHIIPKNEERWRLSQQVLQNLRLSEDLEIQRLLQGQAGETKEIFLAWWNTSWMPDLSRALLILRFRWWYRMLDLRTIGDDMLWAFGRLSAQSQLTQMQNLLRETNEYTIPGERDDILRNLVSMFTSSTYDGRWVYEAVRREIINTENLQIEALTLAQIAASTHQTDEQQRQLDNEKEPPGEDIHEKMYRPGSMETFRSALPKRQLQESVLTLLVPFLEKHQRGPALWHTLLYLNQVSTQLPRETLLDITEKLPGSAIGGEAPWPRIMEHLLAIPHQINQMEQRLLTNICCSRTPQVGILTLLRDRPEFSTHIREVLQRVLQERPLSQIHEAVRVLISQINLTVEEAVSWIILPVPFHTPNPDPEVIKIVIRVLEAWPDFERLRVQVLQSDIFTTPPDFFTAPQRAGLKTIWIQLYIHFARQLGISSKVREQTGQKPIQFHGKTEWVAEANRIIADRSMTVHAARQVAARGRVGADIFDNVLKMLHLDPTAPATDMAVREAAGPFYQRCLRCSNHHL